MILFSVLLSAENEMGIEKIEIKDKEVEKTLRWFFKKPEGDIYKDELEKMERFWIHKRNLKNLEIIKGFINIKTLEISDSTIVSLDGIEEFKGLKMITIINSEIKDF